MLRRARRPVASLCVALLVLDLGGCYSVKQREPAAVFPPASSGSVRQRVIGVTLRDGREVRFDERVQAVVRNDSLHTFINRQPYGVPVTDIQRVWVETLNPGRTTLAVIGITVGVLVVAAAIVDANAPDPEPVSNESCPFVYSWDGTQFVFDAEPYGGAVTRGLEREDFGHLEHLRADSAGLYRLLVTNEVPETQYTNLMRLLVVDHRPGARFEMDEFGGVHAVTSSVAPTSARDQDGRDLVPWLQAADNRIWEPLPPTDTVNGAVRQEITLTFPKPRGATHAQLVARVGTGMWGSHMIRELLALRGSAVQDFYASVDNSRATQDSLRLWNLREELFALRLGVEERDGWRTRGLLPGGGPFISETRVVPLDISGSTGDSLRVRIRPPNGFWALNSFAVSYGDAERPIAVDTVAPFMARTSDGRDLLPDLAATDDRYYTMPTNDDRAEVTFRAPAARPGAQRTVFLHTRGYYRLHLDERGAPDIAALQRIAEQPDEVARMAARSFAKRRAVAATAAPR